MNKIFWPQGVTLPKSNSDKYFKPQDGENRIRPLSAPIFGWIDWDNNKPLRFRYENKPTTSIVEARPVKMFVTFVVWDYADKKVKIYEIQQASIQKAIRDLSFDKEWGDLRSYDLKIIRKGKQKDTEYNVLPVPPAPLSKEAQQAYDRTPVNLELLFEGQDPFLPNSVTFPPEWNVEEETKEDLSYQAIDSLELSALEEVIAEDPDYKEQLLKVLKKQLGQDSLDKLPKEWYDRVYNRARTNYENRKKDETEPEFDAWEA